MLKKLISTIALSGMISFSNAQTHSEKTKSPLEEFVTVDDVTFAIPRRLMGYFKKYPCEFLDIYGASKNYSKTAFWTLPEKFMNEYPHELTALAQMCGENTSGVYSYIDQLTGDSINKMSFSEGFNFISELNKNFGITHFQRYTDSNLMKENLNNLSFMYNSEKPIALVIQNKSDRGGSFTHTWWKKNLEELQKGYKTFVYEADNENDAFYAIKKTSEVYDKISLLILGGHGSPVSLRLGNVDLGPINEREESDINNIQLYEHLYLDVTDKKDFEKYGKHLKKDAKIVLASCSTGRWKESGDNLANALARSLPGRTVYAPVDEVKTPDFIFNDFMSKNTLKEVHYISAIGEKSETYLIKFDECESE